MIRNLRRNKLISQHIDVALVYKDMLGMDEAVAYLEREHIPKDIAQRVLQTEQKRLAADVPAARVVPAPTAPFVHCRRKNHVHHAIVEAAIKIERKLGTQAALALLDTEKVPAPVTARVMAEGPRQVRARKDAPG
jgi:hypothetical protein